jgi:hypothetical protein
MGSRLAPLNKEVGTSAGKEWGDPKGFKATHIWFHDCDLAP